MDNSFEKAVLKLPKDLLERMQGSETSKTETAEFFCNELHENLEGFEDLTVRNVIRQIESSVSQVSCLLAEKKKELSKYQQEMAGIKKVLQTKYLLDSKDLANLTISQHKREHQLNSSISKHANMTAVDLFNKLDHLMENIKTNESNYEELKKDISKYNGLPTNITEAKEMISKANNKILEIEMKLEAFLL